MFEDHQPLKACVTSDEEVLLAVDCLVQAFHSDELANVVVTMNRAEVTVLMTIFAVVSVLTVHFSVENTAISVLSCSFYNRSHFLLHNFFKGMGEDTILSEPTFAIFKQIPAHLSLVCHHLGCLLCQNQFWASLVQVHITTVGVEKARIKTSTIHALINRQLRGRSNACKVCKVQMRRFTDS